MLHKMISPMGGPPNLSQPVNAARDRLIEGKPIQEKLAGSVPRFFNAQGNRSLVGLGSTGVVAAIVFYVTRKYF